MEIFSVPNGVRVNWVNTSTHEVITTATQEDLKQPRLGCARTIELLEELKARGEVSYKIGEYPDEMGALMSVAKQFIIALPEPMLVYRTVDS